MIHLQAQCYTRYAPANLLNVQLWTFLSHIIHGKSYPQLHASRVLVQNSVATFQPLIFLLHIFQAPVLSPPSGGSNLARASEARLLPVPPSHCRLVFGSADHSPRQRPLLQELYKTQLGGRGWQLQVARGRGRGYQT
jgi:hypothetical protein